MSWASYSRIIAKFGRRPVTDYSHNLTYKAKAKTAPAARAKTPEAPLTEAAPLEVLLEDELVLVPVVLILAYGVLGAFFMPFRAVTLLWILNTDRVPREWRNKAWSNVLMVVCALAFAALAVSEIVKAIQKL